MEEINMAWYAGYPREKIQWYPTIDHEKCVECGICMNCGAKVYKWTEDGPVVDQPYKCTVGCTTCATLCQGNAITFPDKKALRELYQKERIWAKVKKELTEIGKLKVEDNKDATTGCCESSAPPEVEHEGCGCGTAESAESAETQPEEDNGCSCGCGGDYTDENVQYNPAEPKTQVSNDFIKKLEEYAHSIGIKSIGYSKVSPELINPGNTPMFPNAIVLTMEMSDDLILTEPGTAAQTLNDAHYEKLGKLTYKIADYLRENGFAAEAAHPYGNIVSFSPVGQKAGLGWIGQSGLLITPASGPRQKISAIFTSIENLPVKDYNEHSWIAEYCKRCGKCIKACPENALIETETCCGGKETKFVEERCIGCSQGCTYCIEDCPFDQKEYTDIKNRFDKLNAKLKEKQNKKFNPELWDNWAKKNSSLFAGLVEGAKIAISMTQNNERIVLLEKVDNNVNVSLKDLKEDLEKPIADLMFDIDEKDIGKLLDDNTPLKFIDLLSSEKIRVYAFRTQIELMDKGYTGFLNRLGLKIGGESCCG